MQLEEFARKLDDLFEIDRFVEPSGWDFALTKVEIASLLKRAPERFAQTFNGLMLGADHGADELARVHLLVFPEATLIDRVIASERERPGRSVIVTHHPVDTETSRRGFIAIPDAQLDRLTTAGIAFYVLHAALDCHETISTSRALGEGLGLEITDSFAPYVGGQTGVIGSQPPESFASFAERVRTLCELPFFLPEQVRHAGRPVSRVAIVAGGGDDATYVAEAEAMGADCYLAGHWWTPHQGEWCDQNRAALSAAIAPSRMNLVSASHDGSELVVFRDQLLPLFTSWGLDVELHRQADHWR